jgi:D-alanine-D-alanine ligase
MFDFDAKYEHKLGETLYLCPPETLSQKLQKEAQRISLEFAKAIKSSSLSRIDLIINAEGLPMVIEANNLPGFTSSSLLPKAAAQAGFPFPLLCAELLKSKTCDCDRTFNF